MRKELNLDQAIAEISRRLKAHISSNGDAHLPASVDSDGFMSKKTFAEHEQLFKERAEGGGSDILKLAPGYYRGGGLMNHPVGDGTNPTSWISNVDVIDGGGGRREIRVRDNASGYLWERTIHSGGDSASGTGGWLQYFGFMKLWSGNSKLLTPVTLTQSVNKFGMIIAEYETTTNNSGFAKGSKTRVPINTFNLGDDPASTVISMIEGRIEFPTSTTAKMTLSKVVNLFGSSSDATDTHMTLAPDQNPINITAIWGVI